MEKLKQLLVEKGVSRKFLDTAELDIIKNVAKVFKIDPTPHMPRDVRLKVNTETGATYVVVDKYPVPKVKDGKYTGETGVARGIYARVELIDDIISDLLIAKGMWEDQQG